MNNLSIQPTFKARYTNTKPIKSSAHKAITPKVIPTENEFGKIWSFVDKVVLHKIDKLKNAPFSKDTYCRSIEMRLKKENINVRFKNNTKLAGYIELGINTLKSKKIALPRNILFASSLFSAIGILGLTYMLNKNKKESPIIFPKDIANQAYKNIKAYKQGEISSPNPLHTFFHEVGHWLHFQKNFNILKNAQTWQNIDTEIIEKEVSKLATKREDGSELCAEIFAASIDNIEYSPYTKYVAKKLNAPI